MPGWMKKLRLELNRNPNRRIVFLLLLTGLSVFVMVQVFLWIFMQMDGELPTPRPVNNTFFTLRNYSMPVEQSYLAVNDTEEWCRQQCLEQARCLTVSTTTTVDHVRNGSLCHLYDNTPLGMDIKPHMHSGAALHVKNSKRDEVLQEDQSAYYAVLDLMTYQAAVAHCTHGFYHLAFGMPGNNVVAMTRIYHRHSRFFTSDNETHVGFFYDSIQKLNISQAELNSMMSTWKYFVTFPEEPDAVYTKRIVYYDGREQLVHPDSQLKGFPFCQGTPFNLRNEARLMRLPTFYGDLPLDSAGSTVPTWNTSEEEES